MLIPRKTGSRFANAASTADIQRATGGPTLIRGPGVDLALDMPARGLALSFNRGLENVCLRFSRRGLRNHSFVLRGEARADTLYQRELTNATFGPAVCSIVDVHVAYECENTFAGDQSAEGIYFAPAWLSSLAGDLCDRRVDYLRVPSRIMFSDPVLLSAASRFAHLIQQAGSPLAVGTMRHFLGVTLLTRHGADLPAKRLRARPLPLTSFRRVADYVDANLGSSFELGDMAVLARLSEHHFLRSFSLATGMTPHQFVLGKRIERAEELLRRTRLPLTRIALDTGFASHSHMSRTFRSKTGRTPTAYRLTASD